MLGSIRQHTKRIVARIVADSLNSRFRARILNVPPHQSERAARRTQAVCRARWGIPPKSLEGARRKP
jgi:hypothetical protein